LVSRLSIFETPRAGTNVTLPAAESLADSLFDPVTDEDVGDEDYHLDPVPRESV
jgi:hypothetical protein